MFNNMMDTIGFVKSADPQLGEAMEKELFRQRRNLELIASENIVSPAVMAAMGSVRKDIREKDTTAAVNMSMWLKILPLSGRKNCLEQSMLMFNLIPARRQIQRYTLLCWNPVILCSV